MTNLRLSPSHLVALGYALLGFTLWAGADSCLKIAGEGGVPVAQILLVLGLSAALSIFLFSATRGSLASLRPRRWKMEIVRSCVIAGTSFAVIEALKVLPLTTVYAGMFLTPFSVALLAALFLKERINGYQGLAVGAGFLGVWVALEPTHFVDLETKVLWGYGALALCMVLYSLSMLLLRLLSRSETNESLAFWPTVARVVLSLPFCLGTFEPLSVTFCLLLIGSGVLSALGWFAMSSAMRRAPAATVAPCHYSQILSGTVLGYVIWDHVPSGHVIIGCCVIIAAGLVLARGARASTKSVPTSAV